MMRRVPVLGLIVWMLIFPILSGAQSPGERAQGTGPEMPAETAPVMLDGKVLFRVRGVTAYPAETRAKDYGERIKAIARDETISLQTLRVVESEEMSGIYAGDRFVLGIGNLDGRLEGVERPLLARVYLRAITEAASAYRRDRSPQVLVRNTLYALGATVLFVVVLLGLRWVFRRLDALVERHVKATLEDLQVVSRRVLKAERI